jgi:hypothetical protein
VLGVLVSIMYGFTAAGLVAAACYAVAFLHAALGRWRPTVDPHDEWSAETVPASQTVKGVVATTDA